MAHGVVEGEALERVNDLLQRAKVRIETRSSIQAQPTTVADESGSLSWIADIRRNWIFGIVAFLVLSVIGILGFRKLRR